MSTFILPVGFIHVTLSIRHALVQRRALVTFAADIEAPPYTQAHADDLMGELVAAIRPRYDSEVTFPTMVTLVGNDGPPGRFESTSVLAGSGVGTSETPPQVALIMQKGTGLSGRRYRGRTYFPFINEAGVDSSGRIDSSGLSAWETVGTTILQVFSTIGADNLAGMVLLHSEVPSTPTPVLTYRPSAVVGTQRRRLDRGIT